MSDSEQLIREFAYQIWESEGRPQGHEARHWEMACKLAQAQASAEARPVKTRAARKPKAAPLASVKTTAASSKKTTPATTRPKP
jgi:hypothetical protein